MVCGERIPQRSIELQINKTINTFNKHSFNISSTQRRPVDNISLWNIDTYLCIRSGTWIHTCV